MLQCTRFAFVAILVILQVFLASTATAKETITLTGLSEPVNDVILSFEVEGKIATIFFREGDEILIDDPLILLNNHLEELEVERNELIWESKIRLSRLALAILYSIFSRFSAIRSR